MAIVQVSCWLLSQGTGNLEYSFHLSRSHALEGHLGLRGVFVRSRPVWLPQSIGQGPSQSTGQSTRLQGRTGTQEPESAVRAQGFGYLEVGHTNEQTGELARSYLPGAEYVLVILGDFTELTSIFPVTVGYIYFDVFNQNMVQYPILRSPEFQVNADSPIRCVSFWFTPFGR